MLTCSKKVDRGVLVVRPHAGSETRMQIVKESETHAHTHTHTYRVREGGRQTETKRNTNRHTVRKSIL